MNFLSYILGKYFLLSLIAHPSVDDNYCYSTDRVKAQQKHYSLQTKHVEYRQTLESTMPGKNSFSAEILNNYCKPKQIWLIMRHGTRYPSKSANERFNILTDVRSFQF